MSWIYLEHPYQVHACSKPFSIVLLCANTDSITDTVGVTEQELKVSGLMWTAESTYILPPHEAFDRQSLVHSVGTKLASPLKLPLRRGQLMHMHLQPLRPEYLSSSSA
ncbi:hypothetical protein XANCAGTX0491_009405 [Xanthoria calcicola]